MVEQLSLFGASSTQQHFQSTVWGLLDFFSASKESTKCKHCILCRIDEECSTAPCDHEERSDGKSGYYSIHETPEL